MSMGAAPIGYAPLYQAEIETEDIGHETKTKRVSRYSRKALPVSILLLSLATNVVLALLLARISRFPQRQNESHMGMANQPYRSIPFQWWSTFSSPNATDIQSVDSAWDGIAKDFGLVAVDHEWAEKRGAPPTMDLPSDPTKGIYVVEAYHTLHCLMKIRESYSRSIRNLSSTVPSHHVGHCFDTLRQHIQCNAPDNLLYTFGKHRSGDGQIRQCRDWDYLHRWTVAHSTCNPITHDPEPILSHYNLCSNDSDGLPGNIIDGLG